MLIDIVGGAPRVAVGLSGGGDSLALLHIVHDWAHAHARAGRGVVALIVDHGLRSGSRADAERAAAAANALGVEAEILTWAEGDGAGGHAAARAARHRLLAEACVARGVRALALAHTADDVAETVLMRIARPARARGLAALAAPIAPSPAWPEGRSVALVRPLLDARRAALRARLAHAGADWIEDPANADDRFERVRARAAATRLEADGVALARWTAIARAAEAADAVERAAAARLFADAGRVDDDGWITLDRVRFAGAPAPVRRRALEAVLGAAAGAPAPIAADALDRLLARIAPGAPFDGATLAGARISPEGARGLVVTRDPGAVLGRADAPARDASALASGVWDGRVEAPRGLTPGERIAPAGAVRDRLEPADRKALAGFPAPARAVAPAALAPDGTARLVRAAFIGSQAIYRRLFPERPRTWCDRGAHE